MEIERRSWYLAVVNEGDGFVDSDKEEQIDLCAMCNVGFHFQQQKR